MPQYLIPQKTQREDKILGPLTGKQMIYALLTLGGSYLLFATLNANPIVEFTSMERMIVVAPLFFLGLALTFVEVNERPFETWLAAFITFVKTPKVRVWEKEIVPLAGFATEQDKTKQQAEVDMSAEPSPLAQTELARLSQLIDNPEAVTLAGPTSKTLELLQTVEKEDPESTAVGAKIPLNVIAKQPKGFNHMLKVLASIPSKILMGKDSSKEAHPQTTVAQQNQTPPTTPQQTNPSLEPLASRPAPIPAATPDPTAAPIDPAQAILEATRQPKNSEAQDKIQNLLNHKS